MNGGDPNWLKGVHEAPQKMQSFLKLNALMAHRPWLINKAIIAVGFIMKGGGHGSARHGVLMVLNARIFFEMVSHYQNSYMR